MADFETTTNPDDCRVWVWGTLDIEDDSRFDHGINIDSFFEFCSVSAKVVYFHNLAFDGMFILYRLLVEGFHFRDDRFLKPRSYTCLISDDGKFYSLTVRWGNGNRTEFRDSLKKLPMTVDRIGKAYRTGFTKGEIDYHVDRPVGYQPSDAELDYLYRDLVIVAKALMIQFDEGMRGLTIGSDSLTDYKATLRGEFNSLFPTFSIGMDSEIRKAYKGGWTYCNPRFQGREVGSGNVYDVNSLYPHVMDSKPLPFGYPRYVAGEPVYGDGFDLAIMSVTVTAKIKPDKLPCIQIKGTPRFVDTEYLTELDEPTNLTCTDVDWALWNDHYDIDVVAFNGSYMFQSATGLFAEYIAKWSKIKAESTGGLREIAKLHLNSLYGKFATNPDVTGKYPALENDRVVLKAGESKTRNPIYTPMGVFITAYARDITIRAAQANFDRFAYADTDSLHLLGDDVPTGVEIDPVRMGAWKHELRFNNAVYVRPKAYSERVNMGSRYHRKGFTGHDYTTRIAGLPLSVSRKLTFKDLRDGATFHGKLTPKRVPGGVVLVDTAFTLKF